MMGHQQSLCLFQMDDTMHTQVCTTLAVYDMQCSKGSVVHYLIVCDLLARVCECVCVCVVLCVFVRVHERVR